MCSLHLTHPSVHTWSSGQSTVQRPGSSRGLPVGSGIRTHNLGLPRVSSPTLYPLGQRLHMRLCELLGRSGLWSGLCELLGRSGLWSGRCELLGRSGLWSGLCEPLGQSGLWSGLCEPLGRSGLWSGLCEPLGRSGLWSGLCELLGRSGRWNGLCELLGRSGRWSGLCGLLEQSGQCCGPGDASCLHRHQWWVQHTSNQSWPKRRIRRCGGHLGRGLRRGRHDASRPWLGKPDVSKFWSGRHDESRPWFSRHVVRLWELMVRCCLRHLVHDFWCVRRLG